MAACDRRLVDVRGTPAERLRQFTAIACASVEAPEVREAARACRRATPRDAAAAALRLVQGLPYVPDPPGAGDWIAHPCWCLSVGGDCEDLATLLVTLWAALGLRGRLEWISQPESGLDHVSARVWLGGRWVWGESTVDAQLGEDPYTAAGRLGRGRGIEAR